MYLLQRETALSNSESCLRLSESTPQKPWTRKHRVWPQKTITLSCEFLIWPKKHYARPSHNLLMTSSTFKCQVLIFATLPLRGIISLMRNTGRHLHPRTSDTWEALSPPTWNLPHFKHAEVKSNILLTFHSPRIRAELTGPERINNWQTVAELLMVRVPGTKKGVDRDEQKGGGKFTTAKLETLSQVLHLWCIF